jgi:hypothetical protein
LGHEFGRGRDVLGRHSIWIDAGLTDGVDNGLVVLGGCLGGALVFEYRVSYRAAALLFGPRDVGFCRFGRRFRRPVFLDLGLELPISTLNAFVGDLGRRQASRPSRDQIRQAEAKGRVPTGLSASSETPGAFVDLGKFDLSPNAEIGKEAQAYVRNEGKENNAEYLLAFDHDGSVIAHGRGSAEGVDLPANLNEALRDPKRRVVTHHNHPSNTSRQQADGGAEIC